MSGIDGEVQREKFLSIHKAIAERESVPLTFRWRKCGRSRFDRQPVRDFVCNMILEG
jgi:hypothetical protein